VIQQLKFSRDLVTCDEAGAVVGFHPHRRCEDAHIENHVVETLNWVGRCKSVENDRPDAVALCQRPAQSGRRDQRILSVTPAPAATNGPLVGSGGNWCGNANDFREPRDDATRAGCGSGVRGATSINFFTSF
jgi:hypothetical protein